MDTPAPNEVNYIYKQITKRARGITKYGDICWFNGFIAGSTLGCFTTFILIRMLKHHGIAFC